MKENKKKVFKFILGFTLVALTSCGSQPISSSTNDSRVESSIYESSSNDENSLSSGVNSSKDESSKFSSADSSSSISSSSKSSSSISGTSMSGQFDTDEVLGCGHHTEISTVTAPTCKQSGYTYHMCLTCGKHKKDTSISNIECNYAYEYSSKSSGYNGSSSYSIRKLCVTCGTTQSGSSLTKTAAKVALNDVSNIDSTDNVGIVANVEGNYKAYPLLGYEFSTWSDGKTDATRNDLPSDVVAIFKFRRNELPIISIDLENNTSLNNIERVQYVGATYTVVNGDKTETLPGTFKGRGNGSWVGGSGKSGYTLKLEKKNKLLGMTAKAKKWAIIACKDDPTMHINQSAYYLARNALDGIEWQVETKYTEIFINKQFRGVYMLTDAVQAATDRVNVKTEDANGDFDLTHENPGFLVEYDKYATQKQTNLAIEQAPKEGISYFKVNGIYRPFTVKYPDPDDSVYYGGTIEDTKFKEVVTNIKNVLQTYSDAITSMDYSQLENLVEMDSMADMYIIHELFKNSDVGWSSFYMYKKPNETKIRFGPAWDFDLAATKARESTTSGCFISTKNSSQDANTNASANYNDMFVKAIKAKDTEGNSAFKNLLISRYKQAFSRIMQGISETCNGYDDNYEAFALNTKKWSVSNRHSEITKLYTWLLDRAEWMENNDFVG